MKGRIPNLPKSLADPVSPRSLILCIFSARAVGGGRRTSGDALESTGNLLGSKARDQEPGSCFCFLNRMDV